MLKKSKYVFILWLVEKNRNGNACHQNLAHNTICHKLEDRIPIYNWLSLKNLIHFQGYVIPYKVAKVTMNVNVFGEFLYENSEICATLECCFQEESPPPPTKPPKKVYCFDFMLVKLLYKSSLYQ